MAAIPFYIYIGSDQINGGPITLRASSEPAAGAGFGGLWGVYRLWPKFSQTVPSDPATGLAPAVPAYTPYWDGTASGGNWVVYHHTNGNSTFVVPGAKGDNWYEFGGGITPCTMLMQLLKEKHSAAPYFKLLKLANNGGIGVGAQPLNGSGWTAFESVYASAIAAMGSDTPDVRAVIIDGSSKDIVAANVNYATHLQTVINSVRTKFGDDCLILLVNHHQDVMKTSLPPVSGVARAANVAIAAANQNVRLLDMNWAKFGPTSIAAYAKEPTDPVYYDTESYVQAGARMFNAIEAFETAAPTAAPGSGIAVVAMITDSQGKTLSPQYAIYGRQGSILGAVGGTVRAGQYIWNGQTRQIELYDAVANACTVPTPSPDSGSMGFEATMMKALAEQYPAGVVLFKYSKNGAAVTAEAVSAGATGAFEASAADLFPDLVAEWNDCRLACLRDLNRVPDDIGVVLCLSDNDTYDLPSANALPEALPVFIDDLREAFTTRANGPALHVTIVQPPTHRDAGGQSVLGIETARSSVQGTVAALAGARDRVTVIPANKNRYELTRDDNIHYAGEATYNLGYDVADAIIAASSGSASGSGSTGGGSLTDGADIPVETDAPAAAPTLTAEGATDIVAALDAAIASGGDVAAYTVDGQTVQMRSLQDLIKARQYYAAQAARKQGMRRTLVQF